MNETPEQQPEDTPHDEELDIEGPNESAPGHNPDDDEPGEQDD